MQSVRNKLLKLEREVSGNGGKLAVVRVKGEGGEAHIDRLIRDAGVNPDDPTNEVVVLRTLYEEPHGELADTPMTAELLYVMDKRR